jgi:hypothetical protein
MDEQRRMCTKHFFVWEQDDSVTSRGRRGLSRIRQILWRNFEKTSKELWRNFERNFEVYFEVLRRNFFNFFHSSDFLRSTLLIEEFQIYVVEYSNIRTYLNYSNFPAALIHHRTNMTSAFLARCNEMRFLVWWPNKKSHVASKFLARHFLVRDVKTIKQESSLAYHDECSKGEIVGGGSPLAMVHTFCEQTNFGVLEGVPTRAHK